MQKLAATYIQAPFMDTSLRWYDGLMVSNLALVRVPVQQSKERNKAKPRHSSEGWSSSPTNTKTRYNLHSSTVYGYQPALV